MPLRERGWDWGRRCELLHRRALPEILSRSESWNPTGWERWGTLVRGSVSERRAELSLGMDGRGRPSPHEPVLVVAENLVKGVTRYRFRYRDEGKG